MPDTILVEDNGSEGLGAQAASGIQTPSGYSLHPSTLGFDRKVFRKKSRKLLFCQSPKNHVPSIPPEICLKLPSIRSTRRCNVITAMYRLVLLEVNAKYDIINKTNVMKNSVHFKIAEEMKYGKNDGTVSGSASR